MSLPLFPSGPLTEARTPNLRPYQEKAIRLARAAIAGGKKRVLLTAPCGAGKMVIVASIIRTSTVPVLFVCHRLELIEQCVEQLARQGISNIGVLRGDDERENPSASVQVASIQTLARRKKPPAGLILIDESHRANSDSYREHLFDAYPEDVILGFTASPCRTDGRPLGELFEELIVAATYSELFKRPNWLVAPDCYSAPVRPDLSGLHITHGDYEETALGEVMSQKVLVGNLLEHWLKLAGRHPVGAADNINGVKTHTAADLLGIIPGAFVEGERRRTFIFAVNLAHSRAICETFAAAGVRIAHVDGTTPENERRAILSDLRAGKLECVSNVGIYLEGVDAPEVKCVVMARPTWSLVLHIQSCGRIFRPWNNIRPLILDHANNWDRHGPPHADRVWSLKNVVERRDHKTAPTKICKACFAYIPLGACVCPYCKCVFKQEEMTLPRENTETLVIRSDSPEVVRKEFFDKMALLARVKGYKPGFASAKHKEQYGEWPPYEWSDRVKAQFASDPFWMDSVARRTKAKEEEENALEETEKEAEPMPVSMDVGSDPWGLVGVDDTYDNGEETFSAWTRREFGG